MQDMMNIKWNTRRRIEKKNKKRKFLQVSTRIVVLIHRMIFFFYFKMHFQSQYRPRTFSSSIDCSRVFVNLNSSKFH